VVESNKRLIFIVVFFSGLVISGIQPKDYFTWFLEVLPEVIPMRFETNPLKIVVSEQELLIILYFISKLLG